MTVKVATLSVAVLLVALIRASTAVGEDESGLYLQEAYDSQTVQHGRRLTAPSPPAPSPQTSGGEYNVSAGPWNTQWSQLEVKAQKSAGIQLLQNVSKAVISGFSSYTIKPGTYRIDQPIGVANTINFTINASGVELIADNKNLHFALGNNTGFLLQGPATLDADPVGFSQGTVVGTDNATYITIRLMAGYEVPNAGVRIMFFEPNAALLPFYQVDIESVTQDSKQKDLYQLVMPPPFWEGYDEARAAAIAIGNLVSVESGELAGGINLSGNNGVKLANLAMVSASLTFGRGEKGLVEISNLRGVRRPGTNRLSGGGFVAVSLTGGSLYMYDSELSYNFDDLTDVQSGLSYAFNQVSSTQLYIGFQDPPSLGTKLLFFDLETLSPEGSAKLLSVEEVESQQIVADFQEGLTDLGLLNWNVTPLLVTLDSPVDMAGMYSLVDDQRTRASSIVFENCFMHDSLASGINAKGAELIIIQNNRVSRAGYRGAAAGFDPYWWEGGVPANIFISGNTIDSTPYSVGVTSPAISTYVDTSAELLAKATASVIHNVTVQNNTVLNPPVAGIGLSFSAYNVIIDNTVVNPVARIADKSRENAQPYAEASAVFLDTIGGTTYILGNSVKDVDRQLVPQTVRISSSTEPMGVVICGNTQANGGGPPQPLPNEFWTTVNHDDLMIRYSGPFARERYIALGSRLNNTFTFVQSTTPNASATLRFTGTRARWYTCLGPNYGMAAIYVDGILVDSVDGSLTRLPDIVPEVNVGFCDQNAFDTGYLPYGAHTLEIVVADQPGADSADNVTRVAVEGFDFLRGQNLCGAFGPIVSPSTGGFTDSPDGSLHSLSIGASGPVSPDSSALPRTPQSAPMNAPSGTEGVAPPPGSPVPASSSSATVSPTLAGRPLPPVGYWPFFLGG